MTTAERIRALLDEIAVLEAQQRADLLATIAATIPPGVLFSARELFDHRIVNPALAAAFDEAGIGTARILGKRLRQMCRAGIERVGIDEHGAIWRCLL